MSFLSAKLYLRPPKSATAADIVIGTAMKRQKGTLHTLIRGPWGSQHCFKPKWHYLILAASGASDQDVWDVYGCNFLWRYQWHQWRPWPTSAARDITDLSPSTFSYPWQLLTSIASFFLSPVSLTPVINIHSRISPQIFEKIQNGPNVILGGLGDIDSWKSRVRLPLKDIVKILIPWIF